MNWQNVKLVWHREIRDQLRDRRTLFVICVLPLMIYPMIGITFSRMSQFIRQHDATVTMVGYEQFDDFKGSPSLVVDDKFNPELLADQQGLDRMQLEFLDDTGGNYKRAQARLESGSTNLVVYFPPGFAEQLEKIREATQSASRATNFTTLDEPPSPEVSHNTEDASSLAKSRVLTVLSRWKSEMVRSNLAAGRLPIGVTKPFQVSVENIAPPETQQASFWAKLLPFIVFICALTGAFYPAVDLCAGEKERGTLETLLTSPASRDEIVGGKLLTVITFSIGSALCNLASMAVTSQMVINQLNQLAPVGQELSAPSLASIGWLLAALLPMSVVFSAASLALASLAGSTKEGQYYLMPLFLVCMPLMVLPLMPGIELTLATSVVPITGMVLLMQAAIEGKLMLAATYLVPVALVTFGCCALAIRWAIDQFNQESVLFRDAENFDLMTWVRYAYNHRPETPKVAAAAVLISLIFLAQFVAQSLVDPSSAFGFEKMVVVSLVGCILLPTLLVSKLFVRSISKTFLMAGPIPWKSTLVAGLLAVVMIPVGVAMMELILVYVPFPNLPELKDKLSQFDTGEGIPTWRLLLLIAVMPAIIEELAFRGLILSGLRSRLPRGWSVVLSALFFGLAHASALQQTISAGFLGLLLGFIAIKTNQITPCIVFHMLYNGLQLLRMVFADTLTNLPWAGWAIQESSSPIVVVGFTTPVVVFCSLAAIALLWQVGPSRRPHVAALDLQGRANSPLQTAAPAEETGA